MPIDKPAAFMSYVHSDDKYGQVTTLRERLSDEVQMQIGTEFPIFQDRKDIQWGQNWRERLEESLDETTFLIPIITPSFFKSQFCRDELSRFLEREKKLKRNDLILPVYFVDTPGLSAPELRARDELTEVIASRQYADWRELRFEPFTNPQVGKTLAQLAVQIRNALPRIHKPQEIFIPSPPRVHQPAVAMTMHAAAQPTRTPTTRNDPPTRIVDPMHRGDFSTISEAIKAVKPGTRIIVRPGLYQEGLVMDKPLEIIGDGQPGDVIVQAGSKPVLQFQTTMGRVVNLTLRQLGGGKWFCVDIAQGRLELEDSIITSYAYSGIGIHGGSDPRVLRNRIHNCIGGVGVYVYENAQGTLEDNDIFGHTFSCVQIGATGNPTLRRNRLHDSNGGGLFAHDGGQGTLEENDIFGNARAGVGIQTAGNPTLRRNRIYHGKEAGVFVYGGGLGTFEDNDIFRNAESGVQIKTSANPTLRNNRINNNSDFAVQVYENGRGTLENNDLTGNAKGAWSISEDSEANVTRVNNKESTE